MSDHFADRLGNVTIANGVVRLDFLRLTSLDTKKKQARLDPAMRLVMPVDGMMQAVEMLDKIRDELLRQIAAQKAASADAAPVQ